MAVKKALPSPISSLPPCPAPLIRRHVVELYIARDYFGRESVTDSNMAKMDFSTRILNAVGIYCWVPPTSHNLEFSTGDGANRAFAPVNSTARCALAGTVTLMTMFCEFSETEIANILPLGQMIMRSDTEETHSISPINQVKVQLGNRV